MAVHARLMNEFTEDEKCHFLRDGSNDHKKISLLRVKRLKSGGGCFLGAAHVEKPRVQAFIKGATFGLFVL